MKRGHILRENKKKTNNSNKNQTASPCPNVSWVFREAVGFVEPLPCVRLRRSPPPRVRSILFLIQLRLCVRPFNRRFRVYICRLEDIYLAVSQRLPPFLGLLFLSLPPVSSIPASRLFPAINSRYTTSYQLYTFSYHAYCELRDNTSVTTVSINRFIKKNK